MCDNAWQILSRDAKHPVGVLTDELLMKFDRLLDWKLLSVNYEFSVDMLRIYQHRVDWVNVLKRKQYPEAFLREMAPNFNNADIWYAVCKYQILTESFVRDYAFKLDDDWHWDILRAKQNLSPEFIAKWAPPPPSATEKEESGEID